MGKKSKRNRKNANVLPPNTDDKVYLYNVNGVKNKSSAKIKAVGSLIIPKDDTIKDQLLKSIEIKPDVIGYTFLCNMTDSFIVSTNKYPVMYTIIDYNKSLLRCSLFKLYLYFTVTDDISKETDLIDHELKGEFSFEVCINDCHKKINKAVPFYLGHNQTLSMIEELLKSSTLDSVIMDLIDEAEETRKKQYSSMFENLSIPKITISLKDC